MDHNEIVFRARMRLFSRWHLYGLSREDVEDAVQSAYLDIIEGGIAFGLRPLYRNATKHLYRRLSERSKITLGTIDGIPTSVERARRDAESAEAAEAKAALIEKQRELISMRDELFRWSASGCVGTPKLRWVDVADLVDAILKQSEYVHERWRLAYYKRLGEMARRYSENPSSVALPFGVGNKTRAAFLNRRAAVDALLKLRT